MLCVDRQENYAYVAIKTKVWCTYRHNWMSSNLLIICFVPILMAENPPERWFCCEQSMLVHKPEYSLGSSVLRYAVLD